MPQSVGRHKGGRSMAPQFSLDGRTAIVTGASFGLGVAMARALGEAGAKMLADGKGGSIINIASIAGMGGQPNFPPAYQATKAAVVNLTRNLACSWADRGVRVNCIAPGWFPSEMTAGWFSIPSFLQ